MSFFKHLFNSDKELTTPKLGPVSIFCKNWVDPAIKKWAWSYSENFEILSEFLAIIVCFMIRKLEMGLIAFIPYFYCWEATKVVFGGFLLGHSMPNEPKFGKLPWWPLQIFMKLSPIDLVNEVWKTWKFQFHKSNGLRDMGF